MGASILDGKGLAEQRIDELRARIQEMDAAGYRTPSLTVILVGSDPASAVYVRNKRRSCERSGIRSLSHALPESTSQDGLLALVEQLNRNPVEFEQAAGRASLITPVPGGVGPMTVASLLENTLRAAESRLSCP